MEGGIPYNWRHDFVHLDDRALAEQAILNPASPM